MYILGISGHHHGAAAALLQDGAVLAAVEEEKMARTRHIGLRQCGGLPYRAIGFCLERAGIGIETVDAAVYDTQPRALLRRGIHLSGGAAYRDPAAFVERSLAGTDEFRERVRTLQRLRQLLGDPGKVIGVDHQLAHAASAFYPSGFDRAAILVLNGRGDYISIAVGIGEKGKVRIVERIPFPHSLGWLYSQITQHLGFGAAGEENRTQWLSLSGEPEFLPIFRELLQVDARGFPVLNEAYFNLLHPKADPFSKLFYEKFGNRPRSRDESLMDWGKRSVWIEAVSRKAGLTAPAKPREGSRQNEGYRRNMACSLQQHLENVVLEMAEAIRRRLETDALCVAGGVALNSLLVSRLERDSGFKQLFVQPAAGNAGCAIGGPLYWWHKRSPAEPVKPWRHVFFGPDYSDRDVKPVLENCKLPYRYIDTHDKLIAELVELLCAGRIVAWYQGPAEFGARSLGARSILASPLQEYVTENLNIYIKHRELFRPFAASVTEERAAEFFENPGPLSRFLLSVSRIREDRRERLPSLWFADGLARVHTVSRSGHPLYWKLLDQFGQKTGVPILINTSFNLFGEPLVCAPRDAVRSFYCSGIDALAINHFLLEK